MCIRDRPRGVRVTEVHRRPGALTDLLMECEFLALIPGQRAPQLRWDLRERGTDPVPDCFRVRLVCRDVDQHHEPGGAFHESAYRRTVPGAHDAITFPVPDLDPVLHLGRPVGDHRHPTQSSLLYTSPRPRDRTR